MRASQSPTYMINATELWQYHAHLGCVPGMQLISQEMKSVNTGVSQPLAITVGPSNTPNLPALLNLTSHFGKFQILHSHDHQINVYYNSHIFFTCVAILGKCLLLQQFFTHTKHNSYCFSFNKINNPSQSRGFTSTNVKSFSIMQKLVRRWKHLNNNCIWKILNQKQHPPSLFLWTFTTRNKFNIFLWHTIYHILVLHDDLFLI